MMNLAIEWAGRTHAGRVREHNEDAFSVANLSAGASGMTDHVGNAAGLPEGGMLFTLADGVGGQSAGEVASALAVAHLGEELAAFEESAEPLVSRACGERLEAAVRRLNGRIRQESAADPDKKDMAATLTCLWLLGRRAFFGQLGDSRLYRQRGEDFFQLSHDQSEVGRAVRSGRISEDEAKITSGRNLLDQALGMRDESIRPEIDWIEPLPGDVYLLCSDGLVDRLLDDDLRASLKRSFGRGASLEAAADALMLEADQSRSRDNVTVLLVRIGDTAPAPSAVAPSTAAGAPEANESSARRFPWPTCIIAALFGAAVGGAIAYFLASG